MRPMFLGKEELDAIARLRAFAESHPIGLAAAEKIRDGHAPQIGERASHAIEIPIGFRVAFAVAELPLQDGSGAAWCRHLSIRLLDGDPEKVTSPAAFDELMPLFGFEGGREGCEVHLAKARDGRQEVVIFSPPMKETPSCR